MVTSEVAKIVTEKLSIPTIGIGSGPYCDGQILVMHDVLGLYDGLTPRFAKRYINLSPLISSALSGFRDEVLGGQYPEPRHSVNMDSSELAKLLRLSSSENGTTPVSEA
jgi:3-methyl-2-oxobutanoate hydroxymethyltransferase